jgi:hypothetical protein
MKVKISHDPSSAKVMLSSSQTGKPFRFVERKDIYLSKGIRNDTPKHPPASTISHSSAASWSFYHAL